MKKETFTEKLIKRTYGISDPLDEYKRREADRIGNKVFMILFYLMIFGNLIPLVLAYQFPQLVALVYPPLILALAMRSESTICIITPKKKAPSIVLKICIVFRRELIKFEFSLVRVSMSGIIKNITVP